MKKLRSYFFSRKDRRKTEQKQEERGAVFETLEPRILLSADISPLEANLNPVINEETTLLEQQADVIQVANGAPIEVHIHEDDHDHIPQSFANQLVFLDLDGAQNISYEGPITINGIDVAAFEAPENLKGQEADIVHALIDSLNESFADQGVTFTTEQPSADKNYSTIYIGGDDSAFSEFGEFFGIAEKVDSGNQDQNDNAFVFSDTIGIQASNAEQYAEQLAFYVAHETGHLLGYEHAHTVHTGEPGDVLAEVAFKPYTHNEVNEDIRKDLLDDGKITIAGEAYDVHPRILEAITKFPTYYSGGSIGPDGFPDLVYGLATIHSQSLGTWVSHVLNSAWQVQTSDTYTESEKLQALAWSYGFVSHAAGDLWIHTLINDMSGGVYPAIFDVITDSTLNSQSIAIRHVLLEDYIKDLTPRADLSDDRGLIADGDVSNNQKAGIQFDAPVKFIYETFIKNLPDTAENGQIDFGEIEFTAEELAALKSAPATSKVSNLDPALKSFIDKVFAQMKSQDGDAVRDENGQPIENSLGIEITKQFYSLSDDADFTVNQPYGTDREGRQILSEWEVRSNFHEYEIRLVEDADGMQSMHIVEITKFRGEIISGLKSAVGILPIRDLLVSALDSLSDLGVNPSGTFTDPLREVIDLLKNTTDRLARGEAFDQDKLLEDFRAVADRFNNFVTEVIQDVVAGNPINENALLELGPDYIEFWIKNIDYGLKNWAVAGKAIGNILYDPNYLRNLQNWDASPVGADVPDATIIDGLPGSTDANGDVIPGSTGNLDAYDLRGEIEADVSFIEMAISALEDPNQDRLTDDSFVNKYFIGMLGLPPSLGELRATLDSFVLELRTQVLDPAIGLVPDTITQPIRGLIDYILGPIKEAISNFIKTQLRERFGVEYEVFEAISAISDTLKGVNIMDIKSLRVNGQEIPLFEQGTRARLDSLLGFTDDTHLNSFDLNVSEIVLKRPDGSIIASENGEPITILVHEDIKGAPKQNAEFDITSFAPLANTIVMTRAGLLVEYDPLAGTSMDTGFVAGQLSQLMENQIDWRNDPRNITGEAYDFSKLNLNGNHGGNIFTATVPKSGTVDVNVPFSIEPRFTDVESDDRVVTQLIDSRPGVFSIDHDHGWRELNYSHSTWPFRMLDAENGTGRAIWTTTGLAAGEYSLQATWQNLLDKSGFGFAKLPATNAEFRIYDGAIDGDNLVGTVTVNQQTAPDGELVAGYAFEGLGLFDITSGTLNIVLDTRGADGVVIAGAIRVVPSVNPSNSRILRVAERADPGDPNSVLIYRNLDGSTTTDPGLDQYSENGAWENLAEVSGTGNYALWESELLRPAFNKLFANWENADPNDTNFYAYGDETSIDPNQDPSIVPGASMEISPLVFDPISNGFGPRGIDIVVTGDETITLTGDVVINSITGDGDAVLDNLTLDVAGDIIFSGMVGGAGLNNITIISGDEVIIENDVVMSSRQIAGNEHMADASLANSGDISISATMITVGKSASLLAHADGSFLAGDITLTVNQPSAQEWEFLGINNFDRRSAKATIDIGEDTNLLGDDISIVSTATNSRIALLDQEFAYATRDVTFGDVDGDGDLDMVTGNFAQPNRLYLNDGSGTFGAGSDITTDAQASSAVALGDMDGDGDLDLVVVNGILDETTGAQANRIYFNDGSGAFGTGVNITADAHDSSDVVLADIDNDGDLDVIVANNGSANRYYLNNGSGAFAAGADLGTATNNSSSVVVGDVDGDGDQDIVIGNNGQANRLLLNQGFDTVTSAWLGYGAASDIGTDVDNTHSIALGDINGDGFLDIVAGNYGQTNKYYLNDGAGAYGDGVDISSDTSNTTSIALGDIDGDGDVDIAAGNNGQANRMFLNQGNDATTGDWNGYGPGSDITADVHATRALALGDADGDGDLDVVAAQEGEVNRYYQTEESLIDGNIIFHPGQDLDVDNRLVDGIDFDGPITVSGDRGIFVSADALAKITVATGSTIVASGNVSFDAYASSLVDITTKRSAWGITYGNSTPTAEVFVENGVVINAAQDFDMSARTTNDLKVTTFVPSLGESTNIAVSLARGVSNSLARIQQGATVEATNASIIAENINSFRNNAIAAGFGVGASDDSGIAATIASSFYQSEATADVAGNINVSGNLDVDGVSYNKANVTRSFGSASGNPAENYANQFTSFFNDTKFEKQVADKLLKFRSPSADSAYAAGIALVTVDNVANALISEGANILVGGNMDVKADAVDRFQISASGNVGTVSAPSDTAVGGAFAYSEASNRANAFVGWNALVDVANTLTIDANANIISPTDPLDLLFAITGFGSAFEAEALGAAYAYGGQMGSSIRNNLDENFDTYSEDLLVDEDKIGTSFVHAAGTTDDGGTSVAGAINIVNTHNAANAAIISGSQVNQRLSTATQDVNVESHGSTDLVNLAGQFSLLSLLTSGEETGVGGFYEAIIANNYSNAFIDDLALVSAGRTVNVLADNYKNSDINDADVIAANGSGSRLFTLAVAGNKADSTAVDGAIVNNDIVNYTQAYIEDRATVNTGQDLNVNAVSDINDTKVAGGIAFGGTTGVGISAALSTVTDITRAFVGDEREEVPAGGFTGGVHGSITVAGNMTVDAQSNTTAIALAIAGADADPGTNNSTGTSNGSGGEFETGTGQDSGFGLSADVAINDVHEYVQSFVRDAVTINVGGLLTVHADSNTTLVAAAGGFAFGTDSTSLSGSNAQNRLTQNTQAFVRNATVQTSVLDVHADADSQVFTLTLGVAGDNEDQSGESDGLSIAGSVNRNKLGFVTQASVGAHADIDTTDLTVNADQDTLLVSVAGGVSETGSGTAIGAGVDLTSIDTDVLSWISGSANVNASQDIDVKADSVADAFIIAGSLALGDDEALAASGTYVTTEFNTSVQAIIAPVAANSEEDKGKVTAGRSIDMDAKDDINLFALAGQLSFTDGSVGFGISFADVDIQQNVKSFIGNAAEVETTGSGLVGYGLAMDATADSSIIVFAAGGDGADTAAVAVSAAKTKVRNTVEAYINGDADVKSAAEITVLAKDDSSIATVAGAGAGAESAGIGASYAENDISNTVSAYIDSATITAPILTVTANQSGNYDVYAMSGSGAESFGGAASYSKNKIRNNTAAYITGNATLFNVNLLTLTAIDNSDSDSFAGAGTGAESAAVGLSVADNDVASNTSAYIGDSTLNTGIVNVLALNDMSADAFAMSGSGAESFAGAGAIAKNKIANTTKSYLTTGAGFIGTDVLVVDATDKSSLGSTAIEGSGAGTASVGASISTNDIGSQVSAHVEDTAIVIGSVSLMANAAMKINNLAIGGNGAGTFAGGWAQTKNRLRNSVSAKLFNNASVDGNSLTISATDSSEVDNVAGQGAGAGTVAIGASVGSNDISNVISAHIENATAASDNVSLVATDDMNVDLLTIAGDGAGTFALGASVALNDIRNSTRAYLTTGAVVPAQSVSIAANDTSNIKVTAIDGVGAGGVAIGASVATNEVSNVVTAYVEGISIEIDNLDISANAAMHIENYAIGGAGAGIVAVQGSVSLNEISNVVDAHIDSNASVKTTNNTRVRATDNSRIENRAGSGAGAFVGVGITYADNDVSNTVRAYIDNASVASQNGTVGVHANSRITLNPMAAAGAGGFVGVGGTFINNLMDNRIQSYISGSTVTAENVAVTTDMEDIIDTFAGSGAGGFVGVGGSNVLNTLKSENKAYIIQSDVIARGTGAATTIPTWDIATGNENNDLLQGLAVQASSSNSVVTYLRSDAGGFVGVANNVSVTKARNVTEAYIDNSQINNDVDPSGEVRVKAHQNSSVVTHGGATAGGFVGGDSSIDTVFMDNKTRAYITDSDGVDTTTVHANGGIDVSTVSRDLIHSNMVGTGVGAVGGANGITYLDSASVSEAYVSEADLFSTSDISVVANSDMNVDIRNGMIGVGAVGVGISIAITDVNNTTTARMTGVNSNAAGETLVRANSKESVSTNVATKGVGLAGQATSVVITDMTAKTNAYIESGARGVSQINQDNAYSSLAQDVLVQANDYATARENIGGSGIGLIDGVGVSVDITEINNQTNAYIGSGSIVNAGRDVDVEATSYWLGDTNVMAFASGIASTLTGAVSLLDIGTRIDSDTYNSILAGSTLENDANSRITFGEDKSQGRAVFGGSAVTAGSDIQVGKFHGWETGNAVVYSNGGGDSIGGLVDGQTYYVISSSQDNPAIQLAATQADAQAGIAINLDGAAATGANHSLVSDDSADFTTTTVDADTNTIDIGSTQAWKTGGVVDPATGIREGGARFATGDALVYGNGGGASIAGLVDGTTYYAIVDENNPNLIRLAASRSDALSVARNEALPEEQRSENIDDLIINISTDVSSNAIHSLTRVDAQDRSVDATDRNRLSVTEELNVGAIDSGTTAFIGNGAVVTAGDDVTVQSDSDIQVKMDVGGDALGLGSISVGGSVGIAKVNNRSDAFISDNAVVQAVDNVNVLADGDILQSHVNTDIGVGGLTIVDLGAAYGKLESSNNARAYIDSGSLITGANIVNVDARTTADYSVTAGASGPTLSGVSVGIVLGQLTEDGTTQAFIGNSATVGDELDPVGTVNVTTSSNINARVQATSNSADLSALSGQMNGARINIKPNLDTVIAGTVNADDLLMRSESGGAVSAAANGDTEIALGAGAETESYANFSPVVSTYIAAGASLNINDTALLESVHNAAGNTVKATGAVRGGSAIGIRESAVTADAAAIVDSFIQQDALINAGNMLTIRAVSTNVADAGGGVKGTTLIAGDGEMDATSYARGLTTAHLDADLSSVGGLLIDVVATDIARARAHAGSAGLLTDGDADAHANVFTEAYAYIDDGVSLNVDNNITINTDVGTEADTYGEARTSLGGISTGGTSAVTTVNPKLSSYIGSGVDITAGGLLRVDAFHGAPSNVIVDGFDGTFDPATAVDNIADSISFDQNHRLQNGDSITYDNGGGTDIAGLENGRTYSAIITDTNTIQLGNQFVIADASDPTVGIDLDKDVIRFGNDDSRTTHNFETGDKVVYNSNGSAPLGGLTDGATYYVRVVDETTIKLANSFEEATAETSFFAADTAVDNLNNRITVNGHGFSNGQAVTYRAPVSSVFVNELVDVVLDTEGALVFDDNGLPETEVNSENIFIRNHGFETGDIITYWSDGAVLDGLADKNDYYVIRISDNVIQLAISEGHAASGIAMGVGPAAGDAVHHIASQGSLPITGLVDGQTYYVTGANSNSFQLANSAGGLAMNIDASGIQGLHRIGSEGIDFTSSSASGAHTLRFDIDASAATGTEHQLVGIGGALTLMTKPLASDGQNTSVSNGSQTSILGGEVNANTETITKPEVRAYIANNSGGSYSVISTGGGVIIGTNSNSDARASADHRNAGGFVSGGKSGAYTESYIISETFVGDYVLIDTQGSFSMSSRSHIFSDGYADGSSGAGLFARGDATASSKQDYKTTATFGMGAEVNARFINSSTGASLYSHLYAESKGGGLFSDIDAKGVTIRVGKKHGAVSEIIVDENAKLSADNVWLSAFNGNLWTRPTAYAYGKSLIGADVDATVTMDMNATARVTIREGAEIIGENGISVNANSSISTSWSARAKCKGFGCDADAKAFITETTHSLINVEENALLRSTDIRLNANTYSYRVSQLIIALDNLKAELAILQELENQDPDSVQYAEEIERVQRQISSTERGFARYNPERRITFNGDAIVDMLGNEPSLEIGSAGQYLGGGGIGFTQDADTINISDIGNNRAPGNIRFSVNEFPVIPVYFNHVGTVDGDRGTITFRMAHDTVRITNRSAKDLVINNIDPIQYNATPRVTIAAQAVPIEFDFVQDYRSTIIIENTDDVNAPNLFLNGVINNPAGDTRLLTASGDIIATGPQALVRTNQFNAEATSGNIGTRVLNGLPTDRLQIELIQSVTGPLKAPVQLDTGLNATAEQDIYLDIKGRLRNDPALAPLTIHMNRFDAGGDVDILFREGTMVTPFANTDPGDPLSDVAGFIGEVVETIPDPDIVTPVITHFRPIAGDPALAYLGVYGVDGPAVETTYLFSGASDVVQAGGNINLVGDLDGEPVHIHGNTNIVGAGWIDAITNGTITLTETLDDMRLGTITSTQQDVNLTASNGSIVDALDDPEADVLGNNITLKALNGGIGSALNVLEIDSANPGFGVVTATSRDDIYLTEYAGDMNINQIISSQADVTLRTLSGALVDANADANTNVGGININLFPVGGGIGAVDNDLDIDSSNVAAGQLHAEAEPGIYINETTGALNVWKVKSTASDVRLTTADDAGTGSDLILLPDSRVIAAGSVLLRAGDNLTTDKSSKIIAGTTATLMGDFANADPGVGSIIDLQGKIFASSADIIGESDNDTVILTNVQEGTPTTVTTLAGDDTVFVETIDDVTSIYTGADNDTINVGNKDNLVDDINAVLSVDGGDGSDTLNVDDSGEPRWYFYSYKYGDTGRYLGDGDKYGYDDDDKYGYDDDDDKDYGYYYQRDNSGVLTQNQLTGLGMPGLINYTALEDLNIDLGPDNSKFTVLNTHAGNTRVNGNNGDDKFYVHRISGNTTINGGAGNDTTWAGDPATQTIDSIAAVLTVNGDSGHDILYVDDSGDTVDNSGTLSSSQIAGLGMAGSISYATLEDLDIQLGSGNDSFTVESTHAADTNIDGNAGNESFNVYSVAGYTLINGGSGDDGFTIGSPTGLVDGIAAELSLKGGSGIDSLAVDDSGDITDNSGTLKKDRISGLGMPGAISYAAMEDLGVVLGSGNDNFTVASTHYAPTRVNTGAGDDTVTVQQANGVTDIDTADGNDQIVFDRADLNAQTNVYGGSGDDQFLVQQLKTMNGSDTLYLDGQDGSDDYTVVTGNSGYESSGQNYVIEVRDSGVNGINSLRVNGSSDGDRLEMGAAAGESYISSIHSSKYSSKVERINFDSGINGVVTVDGQDGSDDITVKDSAHSAIISGGSGNDNIDIRHHQANITVLGGSGYDDIYISNMMQADGTPIVPLGTVTVDAGNDNDDIVVDSVAPVHVVGGLGYDKLTINTTGGDDSIVITENSVIGGGRSVTFEGIEKVTVNAGDGDDIFTIQGTAAGVTTRLNGEGGNDTFDIVGDPANPNVLTSIQGNLNIDGGGYNSYYYYYSSSEVDTLNIFNHGSITDDTGILTESRLSGLGLGANIDFSRIETLNLTLGSGTDTLYVSEKKGVKTRNIVSDANDNIIIIYSDKDDEKDDDLRAATPAGKPVNTVLTPQQLEPIVAEAILRWTAILPSGDIAAIMQNVTIQVADLDGLRLAHADDANSTIYVDINAAGHGWYIDPTPGDDVEFVSQKPRGMDLLTVMMHEIGHMLGFSHTDQFGKPGLMDPTLMSGKRYTTLEDNNASAGNGSMIAMLQQELAGQKLLKKKANSALAPGASWVSSFVNNTNGSALSSANKGINIKITK